MAIVTLVRRLSAVGALWIVLVAATAPSVAAGGLPGLSTDSEAGAEACAAPVLPLLPCVTPVPPPPLVPDPPLLPDSPLLPDGPALVPTVLTGVSDILSMPESPPVPGLLGSVPTLVPQPAGGDPSTEGMDLGQAAAGQPAPTTATDPQPAPGASAVSRPPDDDPSPRGESHESESDTAHVATVPPDAASAAAAGARRTVAAQVEDANALIGGDVPDPAQPIVIALLVGGGASLAWELVRGGGGGLAGVVVFNVWLRRQLRETRMSQRQLAAFSGVDHSTISRLMSGEHEPSLATATKLVEALRKLGGLPHAADYFARLAESPVLPAKRVEAALLGDEELDDEDVRELMNAYLAARARRRRMRGAVAGNGGPIASERRTPA